MNKELLFIKLLHGFVVSLFIANPAFADKFVKHGNNGHASCTSFCANGLRWSGGMGSCVSAYNTRDKKHIGCGVEPGYLDGKELTCTCESGKLPIRSSLKSTVGSHWYMESNITLSNNGRIDARTTTKSCQRKGFTGGVSVAILDKDTNILYISGTHSYGVNGKGFDNRCQQRSANWNEIVPKNIANKVGGLVIYHARNPKPRLSKDDVYEAIEKGAKIYTASQVGG